MSINVDELAQQIAQGLSEYDQQVTDQVKKQIDKVTKLTVESLQSTSPIRTKQYSSSWTSKKSFENTRSKRKTVYNKEHYQITHLLEFGHVSRNGGRVTAVPHIKKAEETAIQNFQIGLRSVLE